MLQIRHGKKSSLNNNTLSRFELGFSSDTHELYIGHPDNTGNPKHDSAIKLSGNNWRLIHTDSNTNIDWKPSYEYDIYAADTSSNPIELQLPPLSEVSSGFLLTFKDFGYNASTNNITIIADGTDEIENGLSGLIINEDGGSISLMHSNDRWFVINTGSSGGIGSGEANYGDNVGTDGIGLYKTKLGVVLQFKKLNNGSAKIVLTDDTINDEVVIDVDETQIDHTNLLNVGTYTHDEIDLHIQDTTNPHEVTYDQTGAAPLVHSHVETDIIDLDKYTQNEVDVMFSTIIHYDENAIHDNEADEINQVTQKAVPNITDKILIEDSENDWNKKSATLGSLGIISNAFVWKYNIQPIEAFDGIRTTFTLPDDYISGTTRVLFNGCRLLLSADYTESAPNQITIILAPNTDDVLVFDYMVASDGRSKVNQSVAETPNNIIVTFTTATNFVPTTTQVYLSGYRMRLCHDYNETGDNQITFIIPPETGDIIVVDYVEQSAYS